MKDYEQGLMLLGLLLLGGALMSTANESSKVVKTGSSLDKAMRSFEEFYAFVQSVDELIVKSKGIMASKSMSFDQKLQAFIYGDRILSRFEDQMLPRAEKYMTEFIELSKQGVYPELEKAMAFSVNCGRNIRMIIDMIKEFLRRGGYMGGHGGGGGGGPPPSGPFFGGGPSGRKAPQPGPGFDSMDNPGPGGPPPPGPPGKSKADAFVQTSAEFDAMQVDDKKHGGAPGGAAMAEIKRNHERLIQEAKAQERAKAWSRIQEIESKAEAALKQKEEAHNNKINNIQMGHSTTLRQVTAEKESAVSQLSRKVKAQQATDKKYRDVEARIAKVTKDLRTAKAGRVQAEAFIKQGASEKAQLLIKNLEAEKAKALADQKKDHERQVNEHIAT